MIYCLTGTFANCSQVFDFPLRDVRKISLLGIATDGNYLDEPVVVLRFRDFICNNWKQTLGFTNNDAVVPIGDFALLYPTPLPIFEGQIGVLPGLSVSFFNTSRASLASITMPVPLDPSTWYGNGLTKISLWFQIDS